MDVGDDGVHRLSAEPGGEPSGRFGGDASLLPRGTHHPGDLGDPERRAIFLVAGNKAAGRQWAAWYPRAIREAEAKYTACLEALEQEKKEGQGRGDSAPWLT